MPTAVAVSWGPRRRRVHEDSARLRKVRVEVRPEDLDKATEAFRGGQEVAVHG